MVLQDRRAVLAFFGFLAVSIFIGRLVSVPPAMVGLLWPLAAFFAGFLMVVPRRSWAPYLAMMVPVSVGMNLWTGKELGLALCWGVLDVLESAAAAWVAQFVAGRGAFGKRVGCDSLAGVAGIIAAGLVAPVLTGVLPALVATGFGFDFFEVYRTWVLAKVVGGVTVVAAVVAVLRTEPGAWGVGWGWFVPVGGFVGLGLSHLVWQWSGGLGLGEVLALGAQTFLLAGLALLRRPYEAGLGLMVNAVAAALLLGAGGSDLERQFEVAAHMIALSALTLLLMGVSGERSAFEAESRRERARLTRLTEAQGSRLEEAEGQLMAVSETLADGFRGPLAVIERGLGEVSGLDGAAQRSEWGRAMRSQLGEVRRLVRLLGRLSVEPGIDRVEVLESGDVARSCWESVRAGYVEAERIDLVLTVLPRVEGDGERLRRGWFRVLETAARLVSGATAPGLVLAFEDGWFWIHRAGVEPVFGSGGVERLEAAVLGVGGEVKVSDGRFGFRFGRVLEGSGSEDFASIFEL